MVDRPGLRQILSDCELIAANSKTEFPQIDSILGQYLSVLISGSIEEDVEKWVAKRASWQNDAEVVRLVSDLLSQTFRTPKTAKLAGILASLSQRYADRFRELYSEEDGASLDFIIDRKNDLAHGDYPAVTVSDVVAHFEKAERVWIAFETAITGN